MSQSTAGDRRTYDDYLAAAAEQLARAGPVGGGRQLKISAVTAAAGINRSALYRLWPSVHELCDDFAIYVSCDLPDWRRQVLLSTRLQDSIGRTIATATDVAYVYATQSTRPIVASTEDRLVRQAVAAAELEWFDRFGAWLGDALAADGRLPAEGLDVRSLAVVLTAMVDGSIMQAGMGSPAVKGFWDATAIAELAAVLERLLDHLTRPGPVRPASSLGPGLPPDQREWTDRQRHVFDAVTDAAERLPFDDDEAPMGSRLVDLGVLARRLGVSERRLYQLWPTSSALNCELMAFQVKRIRSVIDDLVMAVLVSDLRGAVDFHRDVLIGALHAAICAGDDVGINGLFASTFSLLDPDVAAVAAREITAWRSAQQIMFLAGLNLFGFHLGAGVRPEPYTSAVFAYLMGAMRLAQMNPQLRKEQTGYADGTYPLLATGGSAVFRSLSDQCVHPDHLA